MNFASGSFSAANSPQNGLTIYPDYEFRIKLELNRNTAGTLSNVLRFTEPGKQYPNPGSRIPAILQTATNGLKICSFVNANGDYCVDTVDFADGATVDIAVKQSEDFGGVIPGNFKYEILVDGDVVHSAINAEPRVWSNVEAQFGPSAASTPNNQPQATGTYKDLVYISKCDKTSQI